MFQTNLAPAEGLLLVETKASRWNTGIHMLGMFFDLSIIWLDGDRKVVDKGIARRWRSFLFPRNPARYVIECVVSRYEEFQIDDQLAIEKTAYDRLTKRVAVCFGSTSSISGVGAGI